MQSVLVLNADMSVLSFVDMPRAVTLLLSTDKKGLPQAIMFEADPDRKVRSPSMEMDWPRIISLTRYVYVPYESRAGGDISSFATKKDILDRDRRTCAFCGGKGETVDHVLPKSRRGRDTWENLVAACSKCNNSKGDRTPEEWCAASDSHSVAECGHKLLWQPYRPDAVGAAQRRVWDALPT